MPVVQPFTRDMIKEYLQGKSLRFLTDIEGDFQVQFAYDEQVGCELTFYFIAGGSKNQIYVITARSDQHFPRQEWPLVLTLCNTWNADKRWPKAYLNIRDPRTDQDASIVLEQEVDLEPGIHQELFDNLTDTMMATSTQFWMWFKEKHGGR